MTAADALTLLDGILCKLRDLEGCDFDSFESLVTLINKLLEEEVAGFLR